MISINIQEPKIQELPFSYSPGMFLSEKAFNEHLKLYKGYVDKSNAIYEALQTNPERKDANKTQSHYRCLKKGETFALGGVVLHEMYFRNIDKAGQDVPKPGPEFAALAESSFGSFYNWIEDFRACAKGARGWCAACYEQRTGTLRNILSDAHDEGFSMTMYPILVIDMYEHAYYMDFGTDAAKYIEKFLEQVNWQVVEERAAKIR